LLCLFWRWGGGSQELFAWTGLKPWSSQVAKIMVWATGTCQTLFLDLQVKSFDPNQKRPWLLVPVFGNIQETRHTVWKEPQSSVVHQLDGGTERTQSRVLQQQTPHRAVCHRVSILSI
jgi:hypothetical protein